MKTKTTLFFFFLAIFLMGGATAGAQIKFGVKAEIGANKMTLDNQMLEKSNYNSYKFGPAIEMMIPALNIGLEGAILYSNNETTIKYSDSGSKEKAEVHYLDIPVNLKYKMVTTNILGIYASAGPYAHFKLGNNDFFKDLSDNVKAKNFGAGINLGAGIELFRMLQVGAGYSIKLSDDYSADKPVWNDAFNGKKGIWSLSAAVYF